MFALFDFPMVAAYPLRKSYGVRRQRGAATALLTRVIFPGCRSAGEKAVSLLRSATALQRATDSINVLASPWVCFPGIPLPPIHGEDEPLSDPREFTDRGLNPTFRKITLRHPGNDLSD